MYNLSPDLKWVGGTRAGRSLAELELLLQNGTSMTIKRDRVLLVGVAMPEVTVQPRRHKSAHRSQFLQGEDL